jgi:hypothetical protein
MTKIVIVNKLKKHNIINTKKNINIDELYKKCNFKKNNNFALLYEWKINKELYQLWGKNKGTKNLINNFDLTLIKELKINKNIIIYGTFVIVKLNSKIKNEYVDIDICKVIDFDNSIDNSIDNISISSVENNNNTTSIDDSNEINTNESDHSNDNNDLCDNDISSSELKEEEYHYLSDNN